MKALILRLVTACLVSTGPAAAARQCRPSGRITAKPPPLGECSEEKESKCCTEGATYAVYACSPAQTAGRLTLGSFQAGADGRPAASCDSQYHSDDTPVVALSTGWFDRGSRCLHNITVHGNGRRVAATVVDECDSAAGCDAGHRYQPPCGEATVDGSRAVWEALGVPRGRWGSLAVTWSEH